MESLIPSCWYLIPTKLLLMPNKNTLLIMNNSTSFFLFLFTYSSLLATLTTTTCSSSLKLTFFFPTSFIPTQEDKPFTLLLGQTSPLLCLSSFPIPTLLNQASILYTFSPICPWVEQHLEISLEQSPPPTSYATTSISTLLHGWVHLEKSHPHDVEPFHTTLLPHDTSNPLNNPNLTTSSSLLIPSHFIPHYSSIWEVEGWSTMSPPLASGRKCLYFLDLNLIPSTLKATPTIFVPLYSANLTDLGEDQITMS